MKICNVIAAVLFRLGLLTSLGGTAVLAYYNFGRSTFWKDEFDRAVAVVFFGFIIMLVSFALDLIPKIKGDEDGR